MVSCSGGVRTFCACFGPPAAVDDTIGNRNVKNGGNGSEPSLVRARDPVANQHSNCHPAAAAHKSGSLAITFSGGGFLLPYFIGVADTLLQLGVLRIGSAIHLESSPRLNPYSNPSGKSSDPDSELSRNPNPTTSQPLSPSPAFSPPLNPAPPTPLAGSSAGSLIAVSLACGLTPTRILDSFLDTVHDCRTKGSYRRLEEVLLHQLQTSLPADAAERCAGVATVSVTHLFPRPRTRRVSSFASREELIRALMASCHIPTYFNGKVTTTFRGKRTVDGGVTALLPAPVASHAFLLKVCCFPRQQVARLPIFNRARALHQLDLGITPDAFGPWPYNFRYMLAAALHPRSYRFIRVLLEAGRSDAGRWAVTAGIAEPTQLRALTPLPLPAVLLQQPGQHPPDVGPGAGAGADTVWTPEVGENSEVLHAAAAAVIAAGMLVHEAGQQQQQQEDVEGPARAEMLAAAAAVQPARV